MKFETPVLFLIYNRLATTKKVFEKIRSIEPSSLFIAGDGPKSNEIDKSSCSATRNFVLENIDWPCDVKTLFREKNLGCGLAISQAITWFFDHVEEGIIIEDDCLPDLSFFTFCHKLLNKYRDDKTIKIISGNNFQQGNWRGDGTYFFTCRSHIWGWATWRRTWEEYRYDLSYLNDHTAEHLLHKYFFRDQEIRYWKKIFYSVRNKEVDTWAYPLAFSVWHNEGINVAPNLNLVSNIGFGENSTHTKNSKSILANIPVSSVNEIKHPSLTAIDTKADQYYFDHYIDFHRPLFFRIKRKIRQILKRSKKYIANTQKAYTFFFRIGLFGVQIVQDQIMY